MRVSEFKKFCIVDLQFKEITAYRHQKRIERFLKVVDKDSWLVTKEDVRSYLLNVKKKSSPWNYKNELSALKRYFRDYMKRDNIIDGFKFPRMPITIKKVPNKREINKFYNNLETETNCSSCCMLQ